ncbi:MAG: hypothetical protein ABIA74_05975 [bacterium]
MRNVIVVFYDTNEKIYESQIPLLFVGKRNQQLGFDTKIDLLFLSGFKNYSLKYKNDLKSVGYVLHDVSSIFSELNSKYSFLNQYSDYDKKCFLRWLVIKNYFPGEKIIHYDGDIIFNENPEIIKNKVEGKTFVLDESPAFTVVNYPTWFDLYEWNLNNFKDNIFEKFVNDQDFINYLIQNNLLIQDDYSDELKDYVAFSNPLWPKRNNDKQIFEYKRINGVDYFNDKKVLFWHMQTSFKFYLSRFIIRKKFLKVFNKKLSLDANEKSLQNSLINRVYNFVPFYSSRLFVYNYFFGNRDLSSVLNEKVWWQSGVFEHRRK